MASEIRGFTDPASMQAFGNLVSGEQMYDQMAAAAAQNRGNAMLAQQQMAQDYDIAQQRMAQGQQQFEAGLLEAGRQREFLTGERRAEEKFQTEQMTAWQKWEQSKATELRSFDLRLEELRLLAEKARASNNKAALDSINSEMDDLESKQSDAAFRLGFAQTAKDKSEQEIPRLFAEFESQINNAASVRDNATNIGDARGSELAAILQRAERQASSQALQNFGITRSMASGLPGFMLEEGLDYLGMGAGRELQSAEMEGISGAEYLNFRPGSSLGGLSWSQTPAGSLIESEMDPDAMSRIVKSRTNSAIADVMAGLGGDKVALASALQKIDSGDVQGGMRELVAAKVDPYTLRSMLRRYSTDLASGREDRLSKIAQSKSQDGGQRSVRSAALEAAERADETKISYLERMVSSIPVADPSKMKAAVAAAKRMLETRQLVGGDVALVREALPDANISAIESGLLNRQRAADELAKVASEQGRLQQQMNRLGRRASMVGQAGDTAAIDKSLEALRNLMP